MPIEVISLTEKRLRARFVGIPHAYAPRRYVVLFIDRSDGIIKILKMRHNLFSKLPRCATDPELGRDYLVSCGGKAVPLERTPLSSSEISMIRGRPSLLHELKEAGAGLAGTLPANEQFQEA